MNEVYFLWKAFQSLINGCLIITVDYDGAFKGGGGLESFLTSAFMFSDVNLRQWLLIFSSHALAPPPLPQKVIKSINFLRKMVQNDTKIFAYI